MTYFENMVATPEAFKLDLIYNAREILAKAAEEQNMSMIYFIRSEEDNDGELWWKISREHNEIAKGLLIAYEIITNRKVYNYSTAIEEEIKWIEDTFDLSH